MQRTIAICAEKEDQNEINLTPMLDVVFIMLIFFIVTASFIKETGIGISKPDSRREPVDAAANILVAVSENNEIWIERRMIDPRAVRPNIERLHAGNPDAMVIIQADRRSNNNTLVLIMDAARAAGIYDVAIASRQE